MGPLTIQQNASIPIALNLRNRLDGTPIINPGSPARAALQIFFPDGTVKLLTNLPRYTVATPSAVTAGQTIVTTLHTTGGTVPLAYNYATTATETPDQIAAGIAAAINAALPTNWLVEVDGADLVFASPEANDAVSFNVASASSVSITALGIFPTIAWVAAQLQFTPPQTCFSAAGNGTWNAILDMNGDHIVTSAGTFRVVALGQPLYTP